MRILYSHRIQSRDGQSVHVEELIAALRHEGHEVLAIGPSFYENASFGGESNLIARIRALLPGALAELAELAYNVPSYLRLRRAARDFKPDLIYERYNLYYLVGAWLARRTGLPLFLEVNSPLAEERAKLGMLKLGPIGRALERWTWRSADRVLPVTEVLRRMVIAEGVAPERASVVPNGIVLDRFPDSLRPAAKPVLTLGFIGFVRAWHGLDAVIRAMGGVGGTRPIELVVIGDGPARPDLEQLARARDLGDRVRFTGVVDHHEVPALVSGFDIALQPKVVAYASPLKIFDYMAAGCAIVAPDQPNIREILDDGRTALLFDPERDGAMWDAVARLIGDDALRARLGAAARAELERRDFTWIGNARKIAAWAGAAREKTAA